MEPKYEAGGYDLEFVSNPPDALMCLICLLVARSPWQHGACGKLFCKSCLDKHKSKSRNSTCPSCRRENPQYFEDNKSELESVYYFSREVPNH